MGKADKLHMGIITALRGAGGGQEEQRKPIEAPDSLRSVAYARIVDLLSEGEIVGLAKPDNPLACVFLNETPIAQDNGTLNFKNIQVNTRVGTQTQDYLPNFEGVENEMGVSADLRYNIPWVRSITNRNVNSVRVRIAIPVMTRQDSETGDVLGASVSYRIDLQVDGGAFVTVLNGYISGKTTTKYERSHRIELPPAAVGWTLRVTRITPDSQSASIQNATTLQSYTEIIEAKLRMPMSALASIVVDAEQFGNIPARAYHLKGRIIRVPSNYDPDDRTYSGVWDGTFQYRYSNNPAWVFYDMLLNKRYGLGHLVPEELSDKWGLYRIAQYCDQMVPDGFGGVEPRFACNVYLQAQNDALRVMQDLATVFRGIIYANGGTVTPVSDMPDDPVYTYTPANVVDGRFVYSGSSGKVRHTVALVSWNDMSDFGRAKVEYVDDPEGIARYGIQETQITAIGCTSRGQARRWGRYILATERYETDMVTFSVGLDGTVAAPGKLINVADPLRSGQRRGGRISAASANSVTVDFMSLTITPGDTLVATLPQGITERRTVMGVAGNVITVTAPFSAVPVPQSVWAIDSVGVPLATYRVISVAEDTDSNSLGYKIAALEHVQGKFAYADTGEPIESPPIPQIPSNVVPSPTGIGIEQRDVADQNTTVKIVNLSWDIVPVAVSYIVKWRQGEANWIELGQVGFSNIDIPNVNPGPFEVQVIAVNSVGNRSQPAFGGPFDITPVANPPGFVDDIESGLEVLEQIGLDNQTAIAQEIIDRLAGDAQVAADSAQGLANEASERAAQDLAVAQAAATALLNAKLELEAAIGLEATVRQSEDESLAQQIATVAAGTGEQFDAAKISHFDTTLEGWTGTGLTVVDGWMRMGAAATPYAQSPTLTAPFDSTKYRYAKMRARKAGTLTWAGELQWITAADPTWDAIKMVAVAEPVWDGNDVATVDFHDIPWAEGVTAIRLALFDGPTSAVDYYEFDWIAIGRPSPGASAAALQEEITARITADAAEVAQRTTLASQMRGDYTGGDINSLTSGLLYNERIARNTADSALAADITALAANLQNVEDDLGLTASAVSSLEARVTSVEGVNVTQSGQITSLDARLTNAEGVNTAQGTAITNLTARITEAEGEIDVHTGQISNLTAEVAGKASAAALTALTARVTTAEGTISTHTGQITSLDARLTNAEGVNTAQGTAITNLQTSVSDNAGAINVHTSQITDLNAKLIAPFVSGKAWLFNAAHLDTPPYNGFTVSGATLASFPAGNNFGATAITSTGADPVFTSPTFALAGKDATVVRALVRKRTAGGVWEGGLRWATTSHGYDSTHYMTVPVPPVNEWTWLEWKITHADWLASTIAGLRFDFAASNGAIVDVREIHIGDYSTPAAGRAVQVLESRVGSAEGQLTSQASSITSLTANVGTMNASITSLYQVSAAAAVGNSVANPSFEDGSAQWTLTGGAAVINNANVGTGASCLTIIAGSTAMADNYIPVKRDQIVRLGFWKRGVTGSIPNAGSVVRLNVSWYTGSKTLINTVASNCSTNNSSTTGARISGSITVPANAAFMRVTIVTTSTSGTWAVDDVVVEPLTDIEANAFATAGITVDVNGHVTGWRATNDGTTGIFSIVADKFQVVSPTGGARTEFSNGNWRVYDASGVLRVRLGVW